MTARMMPAILARADQPSEEICELAERFGRVFCGESNRDGGRRNGVVIGS